MFNIILLSITSLLKVFSGYFSDKIKSRKPFTIIGYASSTKGVEKALVSDIAPQDLRATAIGLHATLVGVGLLPASILAGMLWKFFGPAAPFYFGGLMGIFASVGLWFILKVV